MTTFCLPGHPLSFSASCFRTLQPFLKEPVQSLLHRIVEGPKGCTRCLDPSPISSILGQASPPRDPSSSPLEVEWVA